MRNTLEEFSKRTFAENLMLKEYERLLQPHKSLMEQVNRFDALTVSVAEKMARDLLNTNFFLENSVIHSRFAVIEQLKQLDSFNNIAKSLNESFSTKALQSIERLTKPYKEIENLLNPKTSLFDFNKPISEQIKGLNLSVIDSKSALDIFKIWNESDVYSQFATLGIDIDSEAHEEINQSVHDHLSVKEIRGIIGYLVSVLLALYALYDSNQMETRLTSKIETESKKQQHEIKNLENLLQTLINSAQVKFDPVDYVVKNRPALVRKSPKSGAAIVANIFSGQVVELVDFEGKWVKVNYYNFLNHKYETGWVLKKYLVRVKPLLSARETNLVSDEQVK